MSRFESYYKDHEKIFEQFRRTESQFGAKRNLLLMNNNVLTFTKFDEIKYCGFAKGATYLPPDEYSITLKNLREHFNDRIYLSKMISLYDELENNYPTTLPDSFMCAAKKIFY